MYSYHTITPRLFCQSKNTVFCSLLQSPAVCFVIFVVELMLCRGSITARRHVLCIGSVSLRRPEGWLFHRSFFCLVHMIPCSVGSCLDHSGALAHLAARFVCGVGDVAPLLWGKVYHTFLLYGRAAFNGGAGDPALPYKKLHSVWAVQLHQNYRFVSRSLFRT